MNGCMVKHHVVYQMCSQYISLVIRSLSFITVISGFVKLWRPLECRCSWALRARQGNYHYLSYIANYILYPTTSVYETPSSELRHLLETAFIVFVRTLASNPLYYSCITGFMLILLGLW